jgi:UDP-N-acetylmuramate dehydrogenase
MNAAVNEAPPRGLLRSEPMSRHTSWRVGGPADLFFKPATRAELQTFLPTVPQEVPIHWVGLGSNLLVRDGGIRGAVIATSGLEKELARLDERRVTAGAGVPCMLLARACVRWQLKPAAFFAGIPGTLGGALAMNAGAFGEETWTRVASVETIDRRGQVHSRTREDFAIGYRSVRGVDGEWFLSATLEFEPDPDASAATIKELLGRRNATQPLGVPSCGSVFRNPPGDFAGRLIERAGLKGLRVGAASVSEKHANFIINTGGASAADIERLIEQVRDGVERACGVRLELEVRVIGERGAS